MAMITGLHHINLVVPADTLAAADAFYGRTLGLAAQAGTLRWFDVGASGQQVHVAVGQAGGLRLRRLGAAPVLPGGRRRRRVHEHRVRGGGLGAPRECDAPGEADSGARGVEYPERFFARDYAGNRLEFTV
ncbi:hypothetical protein F4780DRAFT_784808 [Xylariomycetidae sp. FL0641]|nr:hypothetical protein F4780DRAFT_784808 [Xylariomycetidae sp. FL0641]